MTQDKSGRLFITTASSGVDIFDGVSFKKLGVKDGLISPYIAKTFKDSQGSIWFISTKGLNMYSTDTILSFPLAREKYGMESIFGVEEIGPKHFLLTSDKGVIDFNDGVFQVHASEEFPSMRIFDALRLKSGKIVLISDHGLFELINGNIVRSQIGGGFADKVLLAIWESDQEELYLGTEKGYLIVKEDQVEFKELFDNDSYAVICFLESSSGNFYIGTNGQGLYYKTKGRVDFNRIHEGNGLSDDYTWSLYEDMDGNIWIGTSGAGLDLLAADHFRIFNPEDGLGNDIVYEIIQRDNGDMWFGIIQGGISVYDGKSMRNYGTDDGLSHLSVRSFLDEGDTLWIGTESGLTVYVNGKFIDVSASFELSDYAIFDIDRDSQGVLWFACKGERYYGANGGAVRYKNRKIDHFTTENGMTSDNVYCISESELGDIRFGTTSGISSWDGQRMSRLNTGEPSPCQGTTLAMCNDHKGNTWVGTLEGLGLIRDGRMECFSDRDEVKGKTVYLLANQGDSILWVGSSTGLEKLDLQLFYEKDSLKTTLYNDFNGFFGTECNQNAVTKDRQGNFWFGTISGAVEYIPSNDHSVAVPPRIVINKINKKGHFTDWRALGFKLDKDGLPINMNLAHNENSLQIEFIGISLLEPKAVEYSFLLAGADMGWSDYQKDRSVFYSNLAPGDYSFHVRARNVNSGMVSKTVAFTFAITPAYWQTLWFKVLFLVLLASLITAYFIVRLRSIRKREAEKRDFKHQLAELEMTALRAQMNPHFLFNSLNSVNNFIIKNKKEEASEYLTKFSRLVRIVLQNSKERLVSLENELTALRLYIEMETIRFADQFIYVEDIDRNIDLKNIQLPPLILQPYAENAIWHGLLHLKERTGKLLLKVVKTEKGISISIEDNGIGREKSTLLQSKNAMKKKSLGMKMNEDRMGLSKELYDFSLEVSIVDLLNEKGESDGTRVIINISR